MKKLIYVFFGVLLGIFIFNGIVGDQEDSLKNTTKKVYEQHIENYGQTP